MLYKSAGLYNNAFWTTVSQLTKYYFYLFVHASHLWFYNPLSPMNLQLGLMRLMVTRFQGKTRGTEVLSPEPLKWQHQRQFQSDLLLWFRWFFISVLGPLSFARPLTMLLHANSLVLCQSRVAPSQVPSHLPSVGQRCQLGRSSSKEVRDLHLLYIFSAIVLKEWLYLESFVLVQKRPESFCNLSWIFLQSSYKEAQRANRF